MVREVVVWAVFDGEGLSQMETVAVCAKCLTVTEQMQSTEAGPCGGCGHRLMLATKPKYRDGRQYAFTACCNRCAQRIRRLICTLCGTKFAAVRADASLCSSACKQRGYRQRLRDGRSSASA